MPRYNLSQKTIDSKTAATNQLQWFGIRFSNIGLPKEFFLPVFNAGGLDTTANEVEMHRRSSKGDYVDAWLQSNTKRKAVDRALRGFVATPDSSRRLWVKLLSHQPANLPLRDNKENQTIRRRIAEKLTALITDWQAQRVQVQASSNALPPPSSVPDGSKAREQSNEAEKASDTINQDHTVLPGEGNAAEIPGHEVEKPQQLCFNRPLMPYSDSESGESVADSPRNEPPNSALSSEPSESEDSPPDATISEEQTPRTAIRRRKREDTESTLGSNAYCTAHEELDGPPPAKRTSR